MLRGGVGFKGQVMILATVLVLSVSVVAAKEFYVKPSAPSTECPSAEIPCHSLQDYADQHNFTNNSRFIFLEGEHHLDTMVKVRNLFNLSLVGSSSGVEIVGGSQLAGLHFDQFTGLTIESLGLSYLNVTLAAGSDLNLNNMTISNGVLFKNVAGTFCISNSTFLGPNNIVEIIFSSCHASTQLQFSNNSLSSVLLDLKIACSNIKIVIIDSIFEHGSPLGLSIILDAFANGIFLAGNTTFRNTGMYVENNCKENCFPNLVSLTGVTAINFYLHFHGVPFTIVSIQDSILSYASMPLEFKYSIGDAFGHVIFQNVVVANNSLNSPVVSADNVLLQIVGSTFENNSLSVLWVMDSQLSFDGLSIFRNNTGLVGGAIQLLGLSSVYMTQSAFILFEGNHAEYVGGAIFVHNVVRNSCPFSINTATIKMNFVENTANNGGSSLYGVANDSLCGRDLFNAFNVSNSEADPSAIAADPYNLCICEDGKRSPSCMKRKFSVYAFPGEEFPICLAVVSIGLEGVVPGDIRAFSISPGNALGEAWVSQASSKAYCDSFNFSINTTENIATFKLTTEKSILEKLSKDPVGLDPLEVVVFLRDCPFGFSLSPSSSTCVCDPVFNGTDVQCIINNQSFLRPTGTWIGVGNSLDEPGVIFHPNCPIGYCLPHDVSVTSNTSDSQCEFHRTGLLCGQCENGYSLTLGDGKCVKCSNTYLLLILPLAVAGLLLVAILFALNLTVSEGTINGLIFYANVVAMTHNVLFSEQTSYLYTFVAWLNLDLGVSTCLYNGLDGYVEMWLQFVFPVYMWVIVLVVALVSKMFPRMSQKLGGKYAWKVLATLLLLSYTKLQRSVVTILSYTTLKHSSGDVHYVWLYDANLDFFKGKHLYLGIVAILIILFAIIPYTLLLVFFQQLNSLSKHKLFGWVNKLKPVFDAHAGAYQERYRFWTGMLLVVRTLLIILFTINTTGSADVNLLIILVVSIVLLMVHSNTIYKKLLLNYLESFFYLQLGIFAAGIAYAWHSDGNITAVADTSFGLTLITFLAVVGYHILHRLGLFKTLNHQMNEYAAIEDFSIEHDRSKI